jgi:hypothetical protein
LPLAIFAAEPEIIFFVLKYLRFLFFSLALLTFAVSIESCSKGIPCPKTSGKKTKGKKVRTAEGQVKAGEVTTAQEVNHNKKTGLVKKKKYKNLRNKPNKTQYKQR